MYSKQNKPRMAKVAAALKAHNTCAGNLKCFEYFGLFKITLWYTKISSVVSISRQHSRVNFGRIVESEPEFDIFFPTMKRTVFNHFVEVDV